MLKRAFEEPERKKMMNTHMYSVTPLSLLSGKNLMD
jgi:hypothetical protein